MLKNRAPSVTIEPLDDPARAARFQAQMARLGRNLAWLQSHGQEVYAQHRGKFICVAGEVLFVADSAREAEALGRAAHPDDDGPLVRFIPVEKGPRIYAHQRNLAPVR